MARVPLKVAVLLAAAALAAQVPAAWAQEAPQPSAEAPADPYGEHAGAFFGGGVGGIGFFGTDVVNGTYSGYLTAGGWVTEDLSLAFLFHGAVGPRVKPTFRQGFPPVYFDHDASASVLSFALKGDWYVWEPAPERELYLTLAPGVTEIGTFPTDPLVNTSARGRYEASLIGGVGFSFARYRYVHFNAEALSWSVLTGKTRFSGAGVFLTAWFRLDAGLVGTGDTY